MEPQKIETFEKLCSFLKMTKVRYVYLIHEPYREQETREFSRQLRKQGFIPLIAHDYRTHGTKAVNLAIAMCDFSLVIAFDDETVRKCLNHGLTVFHIEGENQ